jgi:oligopeptide transport system substrate-binding protein
MFDIRTDIPWVRHNPISGETVQEVDSDGNPRFVTAHDFAFSIRRACHPEHGGQASISIAPLIKGCDETLYIENLDDFSAEMLDAIGVSAPSDDTLIIELEEPAGYFLSITPSKLLAASPEWAIDDNGDDWWKPGLIVSSGNYVLHEYISGIRTKLWRNPLMPQDMRGSGNIEHIVTNVVPDINTAYALWLNGEIEEAFLPEGELANHSETYPDETVFSSTLAVDFFGFRMDKPPFDNPDVRRAFSAGYDREAHIEVLLEGQGLPMRHFAPPGIFGAPPLNEVGVGTNIAYAKERLAAAGYPDCEGFPPIVILTYDGEWPVKQAEFAQTQWSENLGCDSDQIEIQQLQFIEMLSELEDADPTAAPHIFTLGWGADYADENNWVGDMLACKGFNTSKRPCDEIDDMIVAARVEANQQVRVDNYRQIEEAFFGEDGSFPIMPVTVIMATWAKRSWLDSIYSQLGGNQWYNWTIDQEAQLAARND